jgi:hypothetical protein
VTECAPCAGDAPFDADAVDTTPVTSVATTAETYTAVNKQKASVAGDAVASSVCNAAKDDDNGGRNCGQASVDNHDVDGEDNGERVDDADDNDAGMASSVPQMINNRRAKHSSTDTEERSLLFTAARCRAAHSHGKDDDDVDDDNDDDEDDDDGIMAGARRQQRFTSEYTLTSALCVCTRTANGGAINERARQRTKQTRDADAAAAVCVTCEVT